MVDAGDDEVVPTEPDHGVEAHRPLSVHELQSLEDELRPLVEPPPVSRQVHAANYAIGVADELTRLILSFVAVTVVLIVVAVMLTPWLWIAVAVWVGLATWTILSFRRRAERRKPRRSPAIDA